MFLVSFSLLQIEGVSSHWVNFHLWNCPTKSNISPCCPSNKSQNLGLYLQLLLLFYLRFPFSAPLLQYYAIHCWLMTFLSGKLALTLKNASVIWPFPSTCLSSLSYGLDYIFPSWQYRSTDCLDNSQMHSHLAGLMKIDLADCQVRNQHLITLLSGIFQVMR